MEKFTIKSDRPAAALYNGQVVQIVRKVRPPDVAFKSETPQVVVLLDGRELYFYANEVVSDKPDTPPPVILAPPEPKPAEPEATPAAKPVEPAPVATETAPPQPADAPK